MMAGKAQARRRHVQARRGGLQGGGKSAVGAGGDYLVLRLPKLQKLAIFDTRKLKVLKYLSSPEDALFAVGREKLVVLNVKQSILQRYDLATGERELSITSPVSNAGAMVMGAASEGPLLVRLGGW